MVKKGKTLSCFPVNSLLEIIPTSNWMNSCLFVVERLGMGEQQIRKAEITTLVFDKFFK